MLVFQGSKERSHTDLFTANQYGVVKFREQTPAPVSILQLKVLIHSGVSDLRRGDFSLDLRKVLEISGHGSATSV